MILKHHTHPARLWRHHGSRGGHLPIIDKDPAGEHRVESCNCTQDSCLATAARPKQTNLLPAMHGKTQIKNGTLKIIVARDTADLKQRPRRRQGIVGTHSRN